MRYILFGLFLSLLTSGDVPPFARIRLYDALVGDGSFRSRLIEKQWQIDAPVGMHQHYQRLALLAARHVLPTCPTMLARATSMLSSIWPF